MRVNIIYKNIKQTRCHLAFDVSVRRQANSQVVHMAGNIIQLDESFVPRAKLTKEPDACTSAELQR